MRKRLKDENDCVYLNNKKGATLINVPKTEDKEKRNRPKKCRTFF